MVKSSTIMMYNVVMLGFSFMFVFTAFQTMGIIEQTVIGSIKQDDPTFQGDGYTSLAIIYAVFATANWLAPSIIALTGPKIAMIIGAVTYVLFIVSFLWPMTWLLYAASVLIGFGAAIIWTGQGTFLTINSNEETMGRNSGIFWAMLQCSLLFGNLFVYFQFAGATHISAHVRTVVFVVLIVVGSIGIIFLLSLKPRRAGANEEHETPYQALRSAFRLLGSKEMIMLSFVFLYSGFELSFFSGVYSTCIGNTKAFGTSAKRFVGLSGIFIGVGEILGGLLFGILGSKTRRAGRDPVVLLGYAVHISAFMLIFVNLADKSPLGETTDIGFMEPSPYVALGCSFLLGFGDACYNTQIYSILGGVWSENSAPAFALFKFAQSLSASATFFYSSVIGLHWQLLILTVMATIGTLTFWQLTSSAAMRNAYHKIDRTTRRV